MTNKILWRWEQDGSGGENGTATYFLDTHNETKVQMPSLAAAQHFYNAIDGAIEKARVDARAGLLEKILRLEK
jgi:hypothetical protein